MSSLKPVYVRKIHSKKLVSLALLVGAAMAVHSMEPLEAVVSSDKITKLLPLEAVLPPLTHGEEPDAHATRTVRAIYVETSADFVPGFIYKTFERGEGGRETDR